MVRPYVDSGGYLEDVLRKPSADALRYEAHHHAITMRELQLLVNPGLGVRREFRGEPRAESITC